MEIDSKSLFDSKKMNFLYIYTSGLFSLIRCSAVYCCIILSANILLASLIALNQNL